MSNNRSKNWLLQNWYLVACYLLFGISALFALYTVFILFIDAQIVSPTVYLYWALGRGIVNGYSLFIDIFETKPPGIALISALSLWLFGNQILGYILYFFTILFLPFIYTFFAFRSGKERVQKILFASLILMSILMLEKYSLRYPAAWGLDYFGVVACLFYVFLLQWPCRKRWLHILLLSLCILFAVGLKESFAISIVASAIILLPTVSTLILGLVLPFLAAAATGLLGLFALGMTHGYFNVYLVEMFGSYLVRRHAGGSTLERFLVLDIVSTHLHAFFPYLPVVVLVLFFLPVYLGNSLLQFCSLFAYCYL